MSEVSVLVVQNNEGAYLKIKESLKEVGVDNIISVRDGFYAINDIINHKPSLVIAELYMSTPNGNDLCAMLKHRKSFQDIPVIITSSEEGMSDVFHMISNANKVVETYQEDGKIELKKAIREILFGETNEEIVSTEAPQESQNELSQFNKESCKDNDNDPEKGSEEENRDEGKVPFTLKRKQQEAV